ncbi:MAG: DNA repair protein RecN, partial [Deltaproteobacteria bacterium]|nr:DNA repair protein RecN [Deltaproteobacteria bacterium]
AMKSLSTKGRVETLVFDEVDTGVGGAMSDVVAKKLLKVSMLHQVFCITHLPQIAAYADRHYRVIKGQNAEGRTVTMVKYLSSKEREDDISRMLGGPSITETTRLHAKELLKLAGK